MPQQLYLSRAAVCVALQITNQLQLRAVREQKLEGSTEAAVGDFVVAINGAMPVVMTPDLFREQWARPDALLAPNHSALIEGLNGFEAAAAERLRPAPIPAPIEMAADAPETVRHQAPRARKRKI